ncbi:hypothetical protein BV96_03723 [Sphingomonas paucimobilis]|nr:hypothetical protein BV96_03723 [Sphingomonas paucimobilis]
MTQSLAATATASRVRGISASVSLRGLTASLVALFALDNVLLLGLLGSPHMLVAGLAIILPAALSFLTYTTMPSQARVRIATLATCFVAAAIILMLGGEGRLFYASTDWQVRDAVLADMGTHHWPFDYWLDGRAQLLRAPVGMYLVPAIVGGTSQLGRDWSLLVHNSLILGLIFAQASALFEGRRARLIAIAVFVAFSGWDVLGNLLLQWTGGEVRWDHIEGWADGYEYSSHITQLFWVPQHAFAGWTVALTYLLWRRNLAPVGLFAASLPLVALWSPLVLFGALPFAAFAGLRVLLTRAWNGRDLLFTVAATALATPALIYLSTHAAAMGGGLLPPKALVYTLVMLFEVIPFLLPVLHDRNNVIDHATKLIAATCLFLMPSWSIGTFGDFQMRASIMPLALVAIAFADWAVRIVHKREKVGFLIIVALGSVTGAVEIAQAFRFAPSPVPRCSLADVWHRQTSRTAPDAAYFVPVEAFRSWVKPVARVSAATPVNCWSHPWRTPLGASKEQQDRA